MLYEIITQSASNSWMFEDRVPHVLAGEYTPHSAADIFVKNLGLLQSTGHSVRLPSPMAIQALSKFTQAAAMGCRSEDDAGVIRVFPGVAPPSRAIDDES